jgi:hypothetical protein
MPDTHSSHEQHPWDGKTPDEMLDLLVRELYAPVSALGDEVDRLVTGAFEDDDLPALLEQMRAGVNDLSRLVVALKRYTRERGASAVPE